MRESNGYLPETSLTISPEPGFDTTVQKLFLDSVVNGNIQRQRNSRTSVTDAECSDQVTSSPEGDFRPGVTRKLSSPGRKLGTGSERLGRPASASSNQSGLLVRKTSQRSNGSGSRSQNETTSKPGRKSVMAVLRQSFRRSKKERPSVTARAPASHLPTNPASKTPTLSNCPSTSSVVKTSVTPTDVSLSRESSKRFDYSTISVASVRTGRTLTPSRVSIVSRGSVGSRTSELTKAEEISSSFSLKVQAGLKAALSDQRCESSESVETRGSDVDIMSASIKTVNPDYSMVGRSRTSPIITSPGTARPRCLPETPKLIPSVVPPIYANVQQQMASGNSRQMSGIAKILEENGNKRHENGVQKSASVSAGPPAIPKPAARLSIRQKVFPCTELN